MKEPVLDTEALLEHDRYVRGLARALVFDPGAADDLVQQTWLAALESGPRDPGSLRAWLASIVRHLAARSVRGDARRSEREQVAARREELPSAAEILEHEALRREVVEAVLQIDEPYRSTLIQRHFQDLPPRAIARHDRVPVETVRTRIKRGHELLRSRLDRARRGERRAWALALVGGLHLQPPPLQVVSLAAHSLIPGVVAMVSMQKALFVGTLVVALSISFVAWRALQPASPETNESISAAQLAPPATSSVASPVEEQGTQRAAVAAQTHELTEAQVPEGGSLEVELVWADDRSPAENVWVSVPAWFGGENQQDAQSARTGPDGKVRFAKVREGSCSVLLDRGQQFEAEIRSGETSYAKAEIVHAFDVEGRVLDAQEHSVPGAAIWLSPDPSGRVGFQVTTSDAQGRFGIRSVASPRMFVNARADAWAPSPAVVVQGETGSMVHLDLTMPGAGGTIAGMVRGPDGESIADALIAVGAFEMFARAPFTTKDGSDALVPGPIEVRSDVNGSFRTSGVAPGRVEVRARASGFAPWKGVADVVANETAPLEIRLDRGVTVAGIATDGAGKPLRVAIGVGWTTDIAGSHVFTAEDGSYRLEHLAAGLIHLRAQSHGRREAQESLQSESGQVLTWNPVLRSGLTVTGRLVDERGQYVEGWYVRAVDPKAEPGSAGHSARCDAQGGFSITDCEDVDYDLLVSDPQTRIAVVHIEHVRPGANPIEIVVPDSAMPSIGIRGTVLDPHGEPVGGAQIFALTPGSVIIEATTKDSGSFELGPLTPASWRVEVHARGYPVLYLKAKDVLPGGVLELGDLRLDVSGSLRVHLVTEGGGSAGNASVFVMREGENQTIYLKLEGEYARSDTLSPGRYVVRWPGDARRGTANTVKSVEVHAGEVTELELPVPLGRLVGLAFDDQIEGLPAEGVQMIVRDKDGMVLIETPLAPEKPYLMGAILTAGHYTVEAKGESGRSAKGEIDVTADGDAHPMFRFTLR